MKKTKTTQPKTPDLTQGRDSFLTPKYAVKLLIPYILKKFTSDKLRIWECAAGEENGFITRALNFYLKSEYKDFSIVESDINGKTKLNHNFITDNHTMYSDCDLILSNPPFSIKFDFITKAIETNKPFAFLIPFDMCGFLFNAFKYDHLQALVPERRIDYLTPNIVERVNVGMGLMEVNKIYELKGKSALKKAEDLDKFEIGVYNNYIRDKGSYTKIEEIPVKLLRKFSSSDFHSFWVLGNFNLEKDFTFAHLSINDKNEIV